MRFKHRLGTFGAIGCSAALMIACKPVAETSAQVSSAAAVAETSDDESIVTDEKMAAKGSRAPDFEMTGIDGKSFRLSDTLKEGKHLVVMFSRAHW